MSDIYQRDLFNATFYNTRTQQHFPASYSMLFQYVLGKHLGLFIIWLFCLIMDFAIFAFFTYHLFLIWKGQTTNETYKWAAVKRIHKKMVLAHKEFKKNCNISANKSRTANDSDRVNEPNAALSGVSQSEESNVGCIPVQTGKIADETTQTSSQENDLNHEFDGRVDPGPFPINIYNKGFIANLKAIVFHPKINLESLPPKSEKNDKAKKKKK